MMCLLKSPVNQNLIIINHNPKGDFNNLIILGGTQEKFVAVLPNDRIN